MEIKFLADCPQYLLTIASWVFNQWGYLSPGSTLNGVIAKFRAHLNRARLPLTLVGLGDEGAPIATASLVRHDMRTRPELTPWLAGVFVVPEHRQRGLGSQIVEATQQVAAELGINKLYLFTPDREAFYARLGWHSLERTNFRGEDIVIMTRELGE